MPAVAPAVAEERLLTFEEFAELPLSFPADLVAGQIVEVSRNNPRHSELVAAFAEVLRRFVRKTKSGELFAGDVAVITKRNPDTGRGADLAFVSHGGSPDNRRTQPPSKSRPTSLWRSSLRATVGTMSWPR